MPDVKVIIKAFEYTTL